MNREQRRRQERDIRRDLRHHGCDCQPTVDGPDDEGHYGAYHKRGCAGGRSLTIFPPIEVDGDLVWLTVPADVPGGPS